MATKYELALEAANNLYEYLKTLSTDKKILEALDREKQLDGLRALPFGEIDSRIAALCLNDVISCFENLGHKPDTEKPESLLLLIFLCKLVSPDMVEMMQSEDSMKQLVASGIVEPFLVGYLSGVSIKYEPRRLLLVDILRSHHVDNDTVNRLVVLIYRYMLIIAEANDTVTPAEKEWLAELMQFSTDKARKEEERKPKGETEEVAENLSDETADDPMQRLDALIGLENVKKEVLNIYNLVKVQKLREEKGMKTIGISYHCVFTGNPGTGKTTVARIVADIYKKLGILQKGHLVETDRSGLVAEYVGQTAVKTNKIIDDALDGVLFIDEAYSLVQGDKNDFGREAISTLLKRMEDDRDRLVVIIAGYSQEMKDFIDANPGLQSRFNRYIHFDDYEADDLAKIFEYNLKKYDYTLTDDARQRLDSVLKEAVDHKDKNFGNARYVRNLFEKTLEKQAMRLVKAEALDEHNLAEITADDIPQQI